MTAFPSTLGMQDPLLQLQAIRQQLELEEQQQREAAARAAMIENLMQRLPIPAGNQEPWRVDPNSQGRMAGGVERGGPPTGPQFNAQTGLTDYLPPHPAMPTMSLPPPPREVPFEETALGQSGWGKTKQPFGKTARAELSQERTDELEERQLRVAARGMGKSALGLTSERQAMKGEPVGLAGLLEMFGPQIAPSAIQLDPGWQRAQAGTAIGTGLAQAQGPVDVAKIVDAVKRMMDPNAAGMSGPLELVRQAYATAEGQPIEFERQLKLAGLARAEIEEWGVKLFGDKWATRHQGFGDSLRGLLGSGPAAVTRRQALPNEPWMDISKFPVTNERKALGR